jgi:parvulin-like peptidyl-prolyl isomerase
MACWGGVEVDDLVVRGRGLEIRRSEVERGVERFRTEALHRGQLLTEVQLDGLREQYLERLLLFRLCASRAEEADRALARIESRKFISGLRQRQGEAAFLGLLKRAGYTEAEFEAEKLAESLVTAVIDREVKGTIRIPSQDVRAYYEANADKWIEPAAVRYLQLQWASTGALSVEAAAAERRQVDAWRTQLERGKDFAALVHEVTAAHPGRASGGERRAVRGELAAELEAEVFRVEPGKLSGIVDAGGALHLIQVLERIPARRMPLERVEEDVRAVLLQREAQPRIAEYLARLRREMNVEVLWKPKPTGK